MVYTSGTVALAALETLVHVDPDEAPEDLVVISAEIPEELAVHRVTDRDLRKGWRATPAPRALQQIGLDWIRKGRSAVLEVPSAIVPDERNYLLNPAHPDFTRIRRGRPRGFALDPRLYG